MPLFFRADDFDVYVFFGWDSFSDVFVFLNSRDLHCFVKFLFWKSMLNDPDNNVKFDILHQIILYLLLPQWQHEHCLDYVVDI